MLLKRFIDNGRMAPIDCQEARFLRPLWNLVQLVGARIGAPRAIDWVCIRQGSQGPGAPVVTEKIQEKTPMRRSIEGTHAATLAAAALARDLDSAVGADGSLMPSGVAAPSR